MRVISVCGIIISISLQGLNQQLIASSSSLKSYLCKKNLWNCQSAVYAGLNLLIMVIYFYPNLFAVEIHFCALLTLTYVLDSYVNMFQILVYILFAVLSYICCSSIYMVLISSRIVSFAFVVSPIVHDQNDHLGTFFNIYNYIIMRLVPGLLLGSS